MNDPTAPQVYLERPLTAVEWFSQTGASQSETMTVHPLQSAVGG